MLTDVPNRVRHIHRGRKAMQVQLVQTGRSAPVIKLGWLYILFFFSKTFLQMLILLIWPLNPKPAWSCWTFSAWLSLTSDPKHQPSNLPWVLEDIVSLLSLSHDQPYCSDLTLSVCERVVGDGVHTIHHGLCRTVLLFPTNCACQEISHLTSGLL